MITPPPGAAIFSLHAIASPAAEIWTTMKNSLLEERNFYIFPSICTGCVNVSYGFTIMNSIIPLPILKHPVCVYLPSIQQHARLFYLPVTPHGNTADFERNCAQNSRNKQVEDVPDFTATRINANQLYCWIQNAWIPLYIFHSYGEAVGCGSSVGIATILRDER